jgi:hypothetical protein
MILTNDDLINSTVGEDSQKQDIAIRLHSSVGGNKHNEDLKKTILSR